MFGTKVNARRGECNKQHGFETQAVQRTREGRGSRFSRSDQGRAVMMS